MTDQTPTATRRSVLRTAAVGGAAAGLGATGVAGASSFEEGDCARVRFDTQTWDYACPEESLGRSLEAGTTGTVEDVCVNSSGITMIHFNPDNCVEWGWTEDGYLEHC